jgi:mono/diheme cytochrome c family protein
MPPRSSRTRACLPAATVGLVICTLLSCASSPPPLPAEGIRAIEDPQLVARGRYLVHGPAHCASCHGNPAREDDLLRGAEIPLSGGRRFDLGILGAVVAPNITSDPIAGIGALSDDALVRSLRYGVSHSGRPLIPLMSFAELADRDLQAIFSFLRTVPPAPGVARPSDLSWLGYLAVNVILKPQSPRARPPSEVRPQRSAEYGRYLAHTVANCHGCHTQRSKLTGAFVGPPFAGGMKITEPGGTFVTPNLTTAADGVLRTLNEQQFVERFRSRAQMPTSSPMPWTAFARMTDDDLGAIYRYLKTLPPTPTPPA